MKKITNTDTRNFNINAVYFYIVLDGGKEIRANKLLDAMELWYLFYVSNGRNKDHIPIQVGKCG